MTPPRYRLRPGMLVPMLVAALVLASIVPARADTASDLAAAMDEVADLHGRAEAASQQVRKAEADHDDAARRLAELVQQVAAQRRAVSESQRALGRAARASYTTAGIDPALYLLLAEDGEEFAAAAQDLHRVATAVTADLAENQDRQAQLEQLEQAVADEEERTARAKEQASAAAAEVQQLLAAAKEREAALERKYAEELAEQRRREAAAAAAAAAAARAAVAAAAPPTAQPSPSAPSAAAPPPAAAPAGITSDQRRRIVEFALSQVGGRYVFGSDGPGSYDCSGLVGAAYAAGGVTVPSYTRALAAMSRAVPMSAALPGDLLFYFGRGAQHVAIYLGDGRMVHAVNPRRGIRVDSVSSSWYVERFTMAGRILP